MIRSSALLLAICVGLFSQTAIGQNGGYRQNSYPNAGYQSGSNDNRQAGYSRYAGNNSRYGNRQGFGGYPGQGPFGTNRIRVIRNGQSVYDSARGDDIKASGVDLEQIMKRVEAYRRGEYENADANKDNQATDEYEEILKPAPDSLNGNREMQGSGGYPGQGPFGTHRIRVIKNGKSVYDSARGDDIKASGVDLEQIMKRVEAYRRGEYENPRTIQDPATENYEQIPKPDKQIPKPDNQIPTPDKL